MEDGTMSLKYTIPAKERVGLLKKLIEEKGFVRLIEVHNGLSALIAQMCSVKKEENVIEYDGFWESSFTDSASKGIPDAEIVGYDSRLVTIDEILNVTSKPMIIDGDTGGSAAQFEYLVRKLGRLGVSGIIIEDKMFPKRNSLDKDAKQILEDPEVFSQKIQRGQEVKLGEDFFIIARIESLIAGRSLNDAVSRARQYIIAGADGIMIHSKKDTPNDILSFASEYEKICIELKRRPILVCVPTTYNLITDKELHDHGFNVIIHANQMLRAAHKSMKKVSEVMLRNDRGFEAEALCSPVSEVFSDVGFIRIKEQDKKYMKEQQIWVIIPAAGKDPNFPEFPKSLVEIHGKHLLDYQIEVIKSANLKNIALVRGYKGNLFHCDDIRYFENSTFDKTYTVHSLFQAESVMENGFILIFSDILFNDDIIKSLFRTKEDIVLVVDNSYQYHKHEIDKKLDLVVSKTKVSSYYRTLHPTGTNEIVRIGKDIKKDDADYEFIGMAYFSAQGANILKKVYHDCLENQHGRFHEATSFDQADITDIIQEIIDRGFMVNALEVYKGWMEIHNSKDMKIAEKMTSSL